MLKQKINKQPISKLKSEIWSILTIYVAWCGHAKKSIRTDLMAELRLPFSSKTFLRLEGIPLTSMSRDPDQKSLNLSDVLAVDCWGEKVALDAKGGDCIEGDWRQVTEPALDVEGGGHRRTCRLQAWRCRQIRVVCHLVESVNNDMWLITLLM